MRTRGSLGSGFPLSAFTFLLLFCSGCIARHITLSEKGLTCADAQRIAIDTVRRMGYTISEATKPTPGSPGMIVAQRTDGTQTRGLVVSVTCTTLGAEVTATSKQAGIGDLNFSSEFRRSFEAATVNRAPPRPPAESGIDVLITPERGGAGVDVGVDLSAAGVLPVAVRITNRTTRTYKFQAKEVRLQTAAGERVMALRLDALTARVGADAAAALRQKTPPDRDIAPNETLTGYLFFPFDSYVRARVQLIDKQSDEGEGFSIEL